MRFTSTVFGVLLVLLTLCAPAIAATAPDAQGVVIGESDISDYPEVALPVHLPPQLVTSAAPSVRVWENGVELEGVSLDRSGEAESTADTVLVIDVSGSMQGEPLRNAKLAAERFISEMGGGDRVALVAFAGTAEQIVGFTGDKALLIEAVGRLEARGETALYDGMIMASRILESSDARARYIVALSDGGDTVSGASLDHAADFVRSSGAVVYAVALLSPEYDAASLEKLAADNGGRLAASQKPEALIELFGGIAQQMRSEQTVRFVSRQPNTKDLEIRVEVAAGGQHGEGTTVLGNPSFEAEPKASSPPRAAMGRGWSAAAAGLISLMVFASVSLGAWYGFSQVEQRASSPAESLARYSFSGVSETSGGAPETGSGSGRGRVLSLLDDVAARRGFTALIGERVERSGLSLRPLEFIYFHFFGVLALGALTWFGSRSPVLFVIAVVCATAAPLLVLDVLADRRRARFHAQLPDILSLMAGSLRTGWALQQSIELVVQQSSEPVRGEFARVQAQVRLGMTLEEALGAVAERLDSADFRWVVTAVGIQREVGGNLAEVLDTVAGTIRERSELQRHVASLTAEGRFSALVLVLMPFVVIAVMSLVSPQYIAPMFSSSTGWALMATGAALLLIGSIWLLKLMKVEV